VIAASPAYHDHPPQRLLQNFPDTTTWNTPSAASTLSKRDGSDDLLTTIVNARAGLLWWQPERDHTVGNT